MSRLNLESGRIVKVKNDHKNNHRADFGLKLQGKINLEEFIVLQFCQSLA